jgi:predicted nuclease of restriction endonuclease-like (RecB) superfamily
LRFSLLQIHVALTLYWNIGKSILQKQKQEGWGKQVIEQLSKDLISRYPDDRGYSKRNLGYMKSFSIFASATCKIRE